MNNLPPFNSKAATPEKAEANTICPSPRTRFNIPFSKNVFPCPPGASINPRNPSLSSSKISLVTISKTSYKIIKIGSNFHLKKLVNKKLKN